MTPPKTISIVVPVYNEAANIPQLYERLQQVLASAAYTYEVIVVDDGSDDESAALLSTLSARDPHLRVLEFTRNFGKEAATTAGVQACRGDACIIIDADLQHPVERIPDFLSAWEAGAEVVIGVRDYTIGEKIIKRLGSRLFYRIMSMIADTNMTPRATDYRLLDRLVIDAFCRLTERNRMTRGLVDWLGFKKTFIHFTAPDRVNGRPAYSFLRLTRLAMSTFVAHSLFPLKVTGYLGIGIVLLSGPLGIFILVENYLFHDPWQLHFSGTTTLAVLNVFLSGIVLMSLGLIALYIANIYAEVANRPLYVLRQKRPKPS